MMPRQFYNNRVVRESQHNTVKGNYTDLIDVGLCELSFPNYPV